MPLESASDINNLNILWPLSGDVKGEGDNHLRMLKAVLKNSFPSLSGMALRNVAKTTNYTVVKTDNYVVFDTTGTLVFNVEAAATLGQHIWLFYVRSGTLQIDPNGAEQINGASTASFIAGDWGIVLCDGVKFTVLSNYSLSAQQAYLKAAYPIGSIYLSVVATNPATLLGIGTWVAFGTGRALVGINPSNILMDTVEETFGSADTVVVTHSHGITDPGHIHTIGTQQVVDREGTGGGTNWNGGISNTSNATTGITINNAGESGTNKNYQPSIAIYMWKRTA